MFGYVFGCLGVCLGVCLDVWKCLGVFGCLGVCLSLLVAMYLFFILLIAIEVAHLGVARNLVIVYSELIVCF